MNLSRRKVWLLIRLLLVTALFVWVAKRVELAPVLAELRQVNLQYLYVILIVWALALTMASLRWKLLIDRLFGRVNLISVLLLNLVGAFYSSFIPGNISGDVVKALYLSRANIRRLDAISAALADRMLGFAVTIWIGLLALLLTPEVRQVMGISQIGVASLFLTSVLLAAMSLILLPKLAWLREQLPQSLRPVFDVVIGYAKHPGTLVLSGIIGILYFAVWAFILWLISLAVQIESLSVVSLGLALAIVNLAQAVPISVNGLGVREGAMLVLLPMFGVSNEKAVVFSLFIAVLGWLAAFLGGLLVIRDVKVLRAESAANG